MQWRGNPVKKSSDFSTKAARLCNALFIVQFKLPKLFNAMPLERLTAFVLPVGKTGLPRLNFVQARNDTQG